MQDKKVKTAAQTGMYLVILAVIAVLVNVISAGTYGRLDTTKSHRYTLSAGSGRLVRSLQEPMEIDAYVTTGMARVDSFVRDLTDLLKEYERSGGGKLQFTIIKADTEELKTQAKDAGLQEMMLGEDDATGEDQATIKQGFMGLVFKYKSEKDTIPQLNPGRTEGLEFWITNKIREIRDKADGIKHRIGVVTGKDELRLDDSNLVAKQGRGGAPSIKAILEQAFPFYTIENVELSADKEIDAQIEGLIITQPRKDYSEEELRRIDQFLMKGGKSLVVYASAPTFEPQDASMKATLSLHNLDKLLGGYGLDLKKNAVYDTRAMMRLPYLSAVGGLSVLRHPGILHVYNDPRLDEKEQLLDTSFAGFLHMEEVAFPFPSSIELLKDKQPGAEFKVVARSSDAATVDADDTQDMALKDEWGAKPPAAQRILAATVKGNLKSAFGPSDAIQHPEAAVQPSRVLLVASGLFLTNPFSYLGNGKEMGGQFAMMGAMGGDEKLQAYSQVYAQRYLTNTILSVKNTLDWMSGDSDLIDASAKILSEPNLTYASLPGVDISPTDKEEDLKRKDEEYRTARKALQRKVQFTLTLGVPVLLAGIGLLRWMGRDRRRVVPRVAAKA